MSEETIDCEITCRLVNMPKKIGTIIQQPIGPELKSAILRVSKEKTSLENSISVEEFGHFYKISMSTDGVVRITQFNVTVGFKVLKIPEGS